MSTPGPPSEAMWEPTDEFWHSPGGSRLPPYNPASKEHYWIIGVAFAWQPGTTVLDHENEVAVSPPACSHCHQFYTEKIFEQPCPGP